MVTSLERARAAAPPLRVRTLGGFAVWRGAEAIPAECWTRRSVAVVFKCLLGAPGQRLHREQLIDLLWPEAEPESGAHRLRDTLHRLRRVLDAPGQAESYVRSLGEQVVLAPLGPEAPASAWLDAAAFAEAASAALTQRDLTAARAALALYTGDYLPGDLYEDWAAARREDLRGQHLALLRHVAALSLAQGEADEAVRHLQAALAADPCQEEVAAALMRALRERGRRAEALRVYEKLTAALRDELGVSPSAALAALHAELLQAESTMTLPEIPLSAPSPTCCTNLPAPLSSFIGREQAMREVLRLLEVSRLLTLTGVGGAGKTRLAVEVARALVPAYRDGVWLVDLAPLQDGSYIASAVAGTLGVREESGRALPETLCDALRSRQLLLVLDNCEHLVAACAELVACLLAACSALRVLATSREMLGLPGEVTWPVPPLALPAEVAGQRPDVGDLSACEAVHLFVARATERRPDFALTARNMGAVVEVVRRLDGLPLAIELAAARLTMLSVEQLAARLDDRFQLLSGGSRTALPRHQALRATLDWSYELLTPAEQALLRRLAVFVGGCTLEAVEIICAGEALAATEMLDLLSALVAKSLVQVRERDGEARYGLLETVRAYARERLEASGEEDATRARHLAYFLDLAEQAESALRGPEQQRWLARLDSEHDNLRAALHRAAERGEPAHGPRLAAALWRFWLTRGYLSEGRRWLEDLLASVTPEPLEARLRARALYGAAWLAHEQGDHAHALALAQDCLALWRQLDDTWGIAAALNIMGSVAHWQGGLAQAAACFEESLARARALGERRAIAVILHNLGGVAMSQGQYTHARARYEESLTLSRVEQDAAGVVSVLCKLGALAYYERRLDEAAAQLDAALVLCRETGDRPQCAVALAHLGHVWRERGAPERALAHYREAVALHLSLGRPSGFAPVLEGLAAVVCTLGQPAHAVYLCAVAACLRARLREPIWLPDRASHEAVLAMARGALGAAGFADAWVTGEHMSPEQAVTEALASVGQEAAGDHALPALPGSGVRAQAPT